MKNTILEHTGPPFYEYDVLDKASNGSVGTIISEDGVEWKATRIKDGQIRTFSSLDSAHQWLNDPSIAFFESI